MSERRRGRTAASARVRNIGGIDTLLALQGVDETVERRRRAVKRGRGALDALDALKLGLLSGTLDTAALARLKTVSAGLAEPTGDPGLDNVLAEIALRVEVELAKVGMPGRPTSPTVRVQSLRAGAESCCGARFPCRRDDRLRCCRLPGRWL